MTTPTLIAASPPALDLDARMALLSVEMDARLAEAAVAFEVNTAHIPGADPVPDLAETIPLTPTLTPAACPYNTPIAATLWRARVRIETDGWLQGARRDEAGARCPDGAIRYEAGSRNEAIDALVILLEAIRRDFTDAETVASWNDTQTSPAPVLLYLGKAAELAHNHSI
jgi:hypothetical protein